MVAAGPRCPTVPALLALAETGWIANEALCVIEQQHDDPFDPPAGFEVISERRYGKAKMLILSYAG